MKIKTKLITVIVITLFLANLLAISIVPLSAKDSNPIFKIKIIAKGADGDISNAFTFIKGTIELDEDSGQLLGEVKFHLKIYDESNKKIYSMKGKLEDAAVMIIPYNYCPVRNVIWTDLWLVSGLGELKTMNTDITIDYRGSTITLPNTGGKYIQSPIMLVISPYGEYVGGVYEGGGWVLAGIPGFGGVTYLTKYIER